MRFPGDPLWAQTMFRQKGAGDEETGIGVGTGKRVDVAAKLGKFLRLPIMVYDDVGLVQRFRPPEGNGNGAKLGTMCDERVAAHPGRVELVRRQKGCDLLIRAAHSERDGQTHRALEVFLQAPEKLQIGCQENWREAEPDRGLEFRFLAKGGLGDQK